MTKNSVTKHFIFPSNSMALKGKKLNLPLNNDQFLTKKLPLAHWVSQDFHVDIVLSFFCNSKKDQSLFR